MKILAALSRFPLPADKGDKLRALEQLKGLSRRHEIHLICLNESPVDESRIAEMKTWCRSVQVFPVSRFRRMMNLLSGFFNRLPFQVNYFHSAEMKQAIADTVKREHIDVIYVQLIRLGLNLPDTQVPMFLDYMDCLSKGLLNRIPASNPVWRLALRMEGNRVLKYEQSIANRFRGWSVISRPDAAALGNEIGEKCVIIPNGVNPFFLEGEMKKEKKFDIFFHGNLSYPPNVQAADYLVHSVGTQLHIQGLNPMICLAGTQPSADVRALAGTRVRVTGFVPDLRKVMAVSRACVAPMFSGSGLQNKLLECMAMGLPVFTTPMANAALGAKPEVEIVVCKDAYDFAKRITWYFTHPDEMEELARRGREFVKQNFDWEQSNRMLEAALEKTLRA